MGKHYKAEDYIRGFISYCNGYVKPTMYISNEYTRRFDIGYEVGKTYFPNEKPKFRGDLKPFIEGFRMYCNGLARSKGPDNIKWHIGYDIAAACYKCQEKRERALSDD